MREGRPAIRETGVQQVVEGNRVPRSSVSRLGKIERLGKLPQFARREPEVLPGNPPQAAEPETLINLRKVRSEKAVVKLGIVGNNHRASRDQAPDAANVQPLSDQLIDRNAMDAHGSRIHGVRARVLEARVTIQHAEKTIATLRPAIKNDLEKSHLYRTVNSLVWPAGHTASKKNDLVLTLD